MMPITLRLSLTFVKLLFAIVLFVFVYKGKNFYRGGKRERGSSCSRGGHCCGFFLTDLYGADVEESFLGRVGVA